MKGNKQEAEYENLEGRHEKSGWRERGNRGSESGGGHWGSSCEAEPGRAERKKQRLSSQNPKLKRPKGSENSGGQKEKRKRQQAVKVEAQKGKKRKRKTGASREKQLQRLMPTEDERKLQTKPA